jgi:WhiB family transcriptional regulator, redox-sensing transcriptional regulator
MTATPATGLRVCDSDPIRTARVGPGADAAEGLWAGVIIPEAGRGRDFALRQLRSLAAHGGYPVRPGYRARRRVVLPGA